jgi:hypothetical protein
MMKVVWTISILFLVLVAVARGQQTSPGRLSDVDKTAIIESVLNLEFQNQNSIPDFAYYREVSSENIEFIEPSLLSKHRFTLVAAWRLDERKKHFGGVKYLLFREIFLRDGVAVVTLSHVAAGPACFGPPYAVERTYTYEARQTADEYEWVAKLVRGPAPSISIPLKHSLLREPPGRNPSRWTRPAGVLTIYPD